MKRSNCIFVLLLATLMASCNRPLGKEAYIDWLTAEKNGLRAVRSAGDHYFDLQYQPPEMIYLQRNPQGGLPGRDREAELEDIAALQYYVLTIGLADNPEDFIVSGTSGPAERQARIYYFSYPFQEHVFLLEEGKKLSPACSILKGPWT